MRLTNEEFIFIDEISSRLKQWLLICCMQNEDKKILYKKCLWKNRKKQRRIAKSFFNYCRYQSAIKNKQWRYFTLKF